LHHAKEEIMPTVHVNDVDINYTEVGQGEALVLLHNHGAGIQAFDFNLPAFSKYYRTIAYDMRGYGQSSKPASGYTNETLAEDLYQLLRHLNVTSCYIVGYAALGISVMFTLFLHHPEMAKALIPVSSGFFSARPRQESSTASSETRITNEFQVLREAAMRGGMAAVLEERKRTMTTWTPRIVNNSEIWKRIEAMFLQTSTDAYLALPERVSEERQREAAELLRKRPVPVMHIIGAEDVSPEQAVQTYRDVCPKYHAVILPESGRFAAIENPDDFNAAVLNFLAGLRLYN
jgi:pimeloyl-ACP methyl ester carboxylesterase